MSIMPRRVNWTLLPLFFVGIMPLLAQSPAEIKIDLSNPGAPLEINRIALGQGGLSPEPMWRDRMPEIRALQPRLIRLFVQEYFDVMPEPGQYDWRKLDRAVDLIRETGAIPLLSITVKPKSLFPVIDDHVTDPTDYARWEDLIFAMVSHYKQRGTGMIYWEVGNEGDIGELGGSPYHFTPEAYVRYYRHTAAAIRRADPGAKVGGPALANSASPILPALLAAANTEGLPLDFVSWHIYNSNPLKIRATIEHVKKLLKQFPKLHPETILDEWNMSLIHPPTDPRFQPAFIAETAWQMKDAGLDDSCYYQIRDYHVRLGMFSGFMSPKGTAGMAKWWNRMPQYDGLFDYQNHVRPSYFAFYLLSRLTGDQLPFVSSIPTIHGFATHDDFLDVDSVMFWNFSNQPRRVQIAIDGSKEMMNAEPLMLDATSPSNDENSRLRPLPEIQIQSGKPIPIDLGPYGVVFWTIEKKKK